MSCVVDKQFFGSLDSLLQVPVEKRALPSFFDNIAIFKSCLERGDLNDSIGRYVVVCKLGVSVESFDTEDEAHQAFSQTTDPLGQALIIRVGRDPNEVIQSAGRVGGLWQVPSSDE